MQRVIFPLTFHSIYLVAIFCETITPDIRHLGKTFTYCTCFSFLRLNQHSPFISSSYWPPPPSSAASPRGVRRRRQQESLGLSGTGTWAGGAGGGKVSGALGAREVRGAWRSEEEQKEQNSCCRMTSVSTYLTLCKGVAEPLLSLTTAQSLGGERIIWMMMLIPWRKTANHHLRYSIVIERESLILLSPPPPPHFLLIFLFSIDWYCLITRMKSASRSGVTVRVSWAGALEQEQSAEFFKQAFLRKKTDKICTFGREKWVMVFLTFALLLMCF